MIKVIPVDGELLGQTFLKHFKSYEKILQDKGYTIQMSIK